MGKEIKIWEGTKRMPWTIEGERSLWSGRKALYGRRFLNKKKKTKIKLIIIFSLTNVKSGGIHCVTK